MLLKRKHREGAGMGLTYARSIDIRVGGTMDGAVVYYADGSKSNCGIADQEEFGGHLAEAKSLSEDEVFNITRVSLRKKGTRCLYGCRSESIQSPFSPRIPKIRTASPVASECASARDVYASVPLWKIAHSLDTKRGRG